MDTFTLVPRWRLQAVLVALLTAGCSGTAPDHTLSGQVKYQGVPVPGGLIVFSPDTDRGTTGPLGTATIQPDGSYAFGSGDPAAVQPGHYRVTIAAVEAPPAHGGLPTMNVPRSLVPEKYRDPETSGLKCEIHGGRANTINFNLE